MGSVRIRSIVTLVAVALAAPACAVEDAPPDVSDDAPPAPGDVPSGPDDAPPGSDAPMPAPPDAPGEPPGPAARPANPTCVAAPRPASTARVTLRRAFGSLRASQLVALVQAPQRRAWYAVEQQGLVQRIDNTGRALRVVDLRGRVDASASETGLLGLAFHPRYPTVPRAFLSYTARENGRLVSRVSRMEVDGAGDLRPDTERVLLRVPQPADNHNGGHIAFGPDGYLYIGLGDGGGANDPFGTGQDPNSLLATLLRIDVDRGATYAIPADNPFASGGGRPEIYAWGLRNPWRFSFDVVTGDLWLGDVGQDRREEINVIERGGNYGWSLREGSLCNRAGCDRGDLIDPVLEYGRDAGRSVTGGVVIRDPALPDLDGTYVFGDFVTGTLWGADASGDNDRLEARPLVEGFGIALSSFASGADGEVYALHYGGPADSAVYRLVAEGDPTDRFPQNLSDTGCFEPSNPRRPVAGLVPYEVSAPLWSDAATKRRWVALPDGQTIDVDARGQWTLPVGSVLVKEFSIGGQLLETRLLMRHDDGEWAGYTYVWNASQTDAALAGPPQRIPAPGGDWQVPGRSQCAECHTAVAGRVLGFSAAQLNFVTETDSGRRNQLDALVDMDLFRGDVDAARAVAVMPGLDSGAPLADRARAYLDSNCAHCHQPGGPGRGDIDLRFSTPFSRQGLCDARPATGDLGIPGARILAPGDPGRSVLLRRVDRRGVAQMPPLATEVVDGDATDVIGDWIRSLDGCGGDWRRTVVFVERETTPGEDVFIRGGIDFDLAADRGIDCSADPRRCSVSIAHRIDGLGVGDRLLDWFGPEPDQDPADVGSPLTWTTDVWPPPWGPRRTVERDGFGETPLNRWGPHHWMLDVDMNCDETVDGWFELKAFSTRRGWEPDIAQSGTPRATRNHWARCGRVNRFVWGRSSAEVRDLPGNGVETPQ